MLQKQLPSRTHFRQNQMASVALQRLIAKLA